MTSDAKIICTVSGGRSSMFMAHEWLAAGNHADLLCFQNTGMETPETYEFLRACDKLFFARFGKRITVAEYTYNRENKWGKKSGVLLRTTDNMNDTLQNTPFDALIDRTAFMPSIFRRNCTEEMKVRSLNRLLRAHFPQIWKSGDKTKLIGFRADEPRRIARMNDANRRREAGDYKGSDKEFHLRAPLAEMSIEQADVLQFWARQKSALKLSFDISSPAVRVSNCVGCFFGNEAAHISEIKNYPRHIEKWRKWESAIIQKRREQVAAYPPEKQRRLVTPSPQREAWAMKKLGRTLTETEREYKPANLGYSWEMMLEYVRNGEGQLIPAAETENLNFGGCNDGDCNLDI